MGVRRELLDTPLPNLASHDPSVGRAASRRRSRDDDTSPGASQPKPRDASIEPPRATGLRGASHSAYSPAPEEHHARASAADGAGSARLDPRSPQLGALGQGRPARRDQSDHAGQARGGRPARAHGPERLAEPPVSQGARPQQRAARAALHADAAARQGRLRRRLLRHLLSRRRLHPPRRALPHVGRGGDVERARSEEGDHVRRGDLRLGRALGRGHHHARRHARRAAPPRRAVRDQDRPVHGWELEDILRARGIKLEPGDAVCVYSGREAWQAREPARSRTAGPSGPAQRSGPGCTSPACRSCATTT